MNLVYRCQICKDDLVDGDRVIFSHKETFVFKPADVPDTVNPAKVSVSELAESRKEYLKTTIANTFCDWGKAAVPEDAFYFRHQWCEPSERAPAEVATRSISTRSASIAAWSNEEATNGVASVNPTVLQ